MSIPFPDIDPVLFSVGILSVRWYSVAYILGLMLAYWYIVIIDKYQLLSRKSLDDLVPWAVGGILLGGRVGYVLFYNFSFYSQHVLDILKIWHGGMSFHGGMVGLVVSTIIFARRHNIRVLAVFDLFACTAPAGVCFGRLANFVNGELFGRQTTVPWGILFPEELMPRHPSQLYEAFVEGLLLFILMTVLVFFTQLRQRCGVLTGIGMVWYGVARFIIEFFREPDTQIGYIMDYLTMGQILSLPMIIVGLCFICSNFKPLHTKTDGSAEQRS